MYNIYKTKPKKSSNAQQITIMNQLYICTSSEFVKILLIKHKQNYWTNNLDVLK